MPCARPRHGLTDGRQPLGFEFLLLQHLDLGDVRGHLDGEGDLAALTVVAHEWNRAHDIVMRLAVGQGAFPLPAPAPDHRRRSGRRYRSLAPRSPLLVDGITRATPPFSIGVSEVLVRLDDLEFSVDDADAHRNLIPEFRSYPTLQVILRHVPSCRLEFYFPAQRLARSSPFAGVRSR